MYGIGSMTGKFPELDAAAATLSGLLCIGGIGGLASQSTARLGAVSGQAGVALQGRLLRPQFAKVDMARPVDHDGPWFLQWRDNIDTGGNLRAHQCEVDCPIKRGFGW